MYSRSQFLAVALPLSALLLALPAQAETMPPLTVVEEDAMAQNIVPTKMADMSDVIISQAINDDAPIQLVRLTDDGMQEALATPAQPVATGGSCTSHKISWQRNCADAGYPESYTGFIRGETEVDCGANEQRDVWLANSCAAPVALAQSVSDVSTPAQPEPLETVEAQPSPEKMTTPQLALTKPALTVPAAIVQPAVKATAPVVLAETTTPVAAVAAPILAGSDGVCGVASKALRIEAPTTDLCQKGTAAAVVGQGPWQWSCEGVGGGKNETCVAMVDIAALAEKQKALLAAAPAPKPAPVVDDTPIAARAPDLPPVTPEAPLLAAAPALSTPQLATPTLTAEISTQTPPLATAALATPRLMLPSRSTIPVASSMDYAPAEPVRAAGTLQPRMGNDSGMIEAGLGRLQFARGNEAPDEAVLGQLESLGQKLAVDRLAKITVTAYANTDQDTDARAARRLSLARAFAVRDALMLGGASSDQIRIRALGANGNGGDLDRAELTEN